MKHLLISVKNRFLFKTRDGRVFTLLVTLFFSFHQTIAQENHQQLINELKKKIENTKNSGRLFYMDSLSRMSLRLELDDYEHIATSTINYALKIDSTDKAMYHTYKLMRHYYSVGTFKKTISFYEDHLKQNLHKLTAKQKAELYLEMADHYDYTGNRTVSLQLYDSTITISQQYRLDTIHAQAYQYKGYVYANMGSFAQAALSLTDAQKQYRAIKDTTEVLFIELTVASLYSMIGLYDEAKRSRKAVEKETLARKDYDILTNLYFNQSTDEKLQGNRADEIRLIKKAIKYAVMDESLDMHSLDFYPRLSSAYSETDSLELASYYLEKIKMIETAKKNDITRNMYLLAAKDYAFAKADYPQAAALSEEHLTLLRRYEGYDHLTEAELFMSKAYDKVGMQEEALAAYRTYMAIRDTIFESQRTNALSYYQTLNETEKKETQIGKQQEELQRLDDRNRLKNLYILLGAFGILFVSGIIIFITSRRRTRFKQQQQSQFTKKLLQTQEQERVRIARDIHDSVGQKLVLLSKSSTEDNYKDYSHLAGESLSELREISSGLYPMNLERLGLAASLRSMINQIDSANTILLEHSIDDLDNELNSEEQLQLYRIVQEALNNIIKHSKAHEASITLKKTKGYELNITDNGSGFSPEKTGNGIGISTMKQRASMINARLHITSKPAQGTTIILQHYD